MTQLANGSRQQISIAEEEVFGTTPNANGKIFRFTSESLQKNVNQVTSGEVEPSGMVTDRKKVGVTAQGDISGEFSIGNLDSILEGVLRNEFDNYSITREMSYVVEGTKITSATGDFTETFEPGMFILPKGFTEGADKFDKAVKITAVSELELTLDVSDLNVAPVGETSTVTIAGKTLKNGTVLKTYSIEKFFSDVKKYFFYNGCIINQLNFTFPDQNIITCDVSFSGAEEDISESSIFSGYDNMSANEILDTSNNMPSIRFNEVSIPSQTFDLSINNNARMNTAQGSKKAIAGSQGTQDITGSMNVYFKDFVQYNLFKNDTTISFDYQVKDKDGNFFVVSIPSAKITACPIVGGGKDTDVVANIAFGAIKDETLEYQIRIDQILKLEETE